MLCISADIRNLATKAGRDITKDLLDWLKTQYGTTSISTVYSDVVVRGQKRIWKFYCVKKKRNMRQPSIAC